MPGFLGKKFPAPVGTSIGPLLGPTRQPEDGLANDAQLSPCGLSTSPVRRTRIPIERLERGDSRMFEKMRLMCFGARGRWKNWGQG
jgi:hypothetical protein